MNPIVRKEQGTWVTIDRRDSAGNVSKTWGREVIIVISRIVL